MVDWDEIYRLQQEAIDNRKAVAIANQKLSALERSRAEAALRNARKQARVTTNVSRDIPEEQPYRKRVEREPTEYPYDEEPDDDNYRKLYACIMKGLSRYPCSRYQKRRALFTALDRYPK